MCITIGSVTSAHTMAIVQPDKVKKMSWDGVGGERVEEGVYERE